MAGIRLEVIVGVGHQIDQFSNDSLAAVRRANEEVDRAVESLRYAFQQNVAYVNAAIARAREKFAGDIRRLYEAAMSGIELDARAAQKQVTAPDLPRPSHLAGWPCFRDGRWWSDEHGRWVTPRELAELEEAKYTSPAVANVLADTLRRELVIFPEWGNDQMHSEAEIDADVKRVMNDFGVR